MFQIVLVYLFAFFFEAVVLALTLWIVADDEAGPFRVEGTKTTWIRCFALVSIVSLVQLIPFGRLLGIVVWLVGLMMMFSRSFGQAVILTIANWVVSLGIIWCISTALDFFMGSSITSELF